MTTTMKSGQRFKAERAITTAMGTTIPAGEELQVILVSGGQAKLWHEATMTRFWVAA